MTNTFISASFSSKSFLSVGEQEGRLVQTSDIARKLLIVVGLILISVDIAFIVMYQSVASKVYNITTDILFALADVLLVTMLILLIRIIQKHFKKDLQKETV